MKKVFCKKLALLLAVIMLCSLLPQPVAHAGTEKPASYRWEIVGDVLTSVATGSNVLNTPTRNAGSISNGKMTGGRFTLAKPVELKHDKPWAVEWRSTGSWSGMLLASADQSPSNGLTYLFRDTGTKLFAQGEYNGSWNNYGMILDCDMTTAHVFRLENRVKADGTNGVYLLVDGQEIDAMEQYYVSAKDQNQRINWANGKDIRVSNIGTSSHPVNNLQLEYLQIWENTCLHVFEAGVCTHCGEYEPVLQGKVVSVLGDSISTFAGYIPVEDGFNMEHLARYPQDNLLTDVNETWWMQVICQLGGKLGINDSWRGATCSGAAPVTTGTTGENASMANLTRIQNLGSNGTPDVILFYGGTNDLAHVQKVGSFDPANAPAAVDLTTKKWDNLADGYVNTLLRLRHFYPDALIVCLLPTYTTSYYSDTKLAQGNEILAAICEHYEVPYVDLRECGITIQDLPDGIHPDARGMDFITDAVVKLLSGCELAAGENTVYQVTHDLVGAKATRSYYKGISAGKAFEETISGEDLSVTVTMGGVDITASVYADGVISIPAVTGDLRITARGEVICSYAGHRTELPECFCGETNLWAAVEHDTQYYTVNGWDVHSSSKVRSVTIPVTPGERIWATSFQASGINGGSMNGIRLTWFDEADVLKSIDADKVYSEFAEKGFISVPDGVAAANIVMWNDSLENELYLLDREHVYERGICAGCGDAATLEGKTLSILGDSISTFSGVSNNGAANGTISGNAIFYKPGTLGVNQPDTWWQQTVDHLGLELLVNNSWSGSCIRQTRSGAPGAYLDRCVQLHNNEGEEPDIIAVYLGTNDYYNHMSTLGSAELDYDKLITETVDGGFAYAAPATVCEAYAIMLHKMTERYPDAEVYCFTILPNRSLSASKIQLLEQFNANIGQIADHFDAYTVDLYGDSGIKADKNYSFYMGDNYHPGPAGMDAMTGCFTSSLIQNSNYVADPVFDVTYELNDVIVNQGTAYALREGDSFVCDFTIPADYAASVKVTMNGVDITETAYASGRVHITEVTGDIHITASAKLAPEEPENFRWEIVNDVLTSVTIGGNAANTPTMTHGTIADGKLKGARFTLERPVRLMHDRPWVIEWKSQGTWSDTTDGALLFAGDPTSSTAEKPYLYRRHNSDFIALGVNSGGQYHNYGVSLKANGIDGTLEHTYRLENRLLDDGSNMVYLYVDGEEIGAMTHHWIGGTDQKEEVNWLNGQDLVFSYMGTTPHTIGNCYIDYVLVLENGHIHTYKAVVTAPTCTEAGFTTYTCECGESYVDQETEATGHDVVTTTGVRANSLRPGLTQGSHCDTCGDILAEQTVIPAKGYDWMVEDGEFKLLLIGNSFSQDASSCGFGMTESQLYNMLQAMLGEDVKVTLGLLYSGGKGVHWYATQTEQGTKAPSFYTISPEKTVWTSRGGTSTQTALTWTDWDVVTLQPYDVNFTKGQEGVPEKYKAETDEKFYPLETATEYMLDFIGVHAPQADVYCYMHWARSSATVASLNASLSTYQNFAAFYPKGMDYLGTETGNQYTSIIPVGLSIQNARTTYLSTLSYNIGNTVDLKNDPQIGLQRDGGHVTFNVGRYIAGLTFAEMLIPQQLRTDGYVLPDIRITESVGELPKEYTQISQKAVLAAVESWKLGSLAVTNMEGYSEDPTVAAKKNLEKMSLNLKCGSAAAIDQQIREAAASVLPPDFVIEDLVMDAARKTALITVRFGYTSVTAGMRYTITEHTYENGACTLCGIRQTSTFQILDTRCNRTETFTYEVGMTWKQWLNSRYNTGMGSCIAIWVSAGPDILGLNPYMDIYVNGDICNYGAEICPTDQIELVKDK